MSILNHVCFREILLFYCNIKIGFCFSNEVPSMKVKLFVPMLSILVIGSNFDLTSGVIWEWATEKSVLVLIQPSSFLIFRFDTTLIQDRRVCWRTLHTYQQRSQDSKEMNPSLHNGIIELLFILLKENSHEIILRFKLIFSYLILDSFLSLVFTPSGVWLSRCKTGSSARLRVVHWNRLIGVG